MTPKSKELFLEHLMEPASDSNLADCLWTPWNSPHQTSWWSFQTPHCLLQRFVTGLRTGWRTPILNLSLLKETKKKKKKRQACPPQANQVLTRRSGSWICWKEGEPVKSQNSFHPFTPILMLHQELQNKTTLRNSKSIRRRLKGPRIY